MRRRLVAGAVTVLVMAPWHGPGAQGVSGAEFSAEMVQTGPQGASVSGKMYVGKDKVRTEFTQDGKTMVRIVDNANQVAYVLFPDQKSYIEQHAPAGPKPASQETEKDPCAGMPGLTCTKLGTEEVSGRKADKWEVVSNFQGKTMRSVQWLDTERGIPLKQEWSGGQKMELQML